MREDELNRIARKLKAVLGAKALDALARSTEFVVRRRTITTDLFVPSLLKSFGSRRVESIADLVRDFNYDHEQSVCYKPYYEASALVRNDPPLLMKRDPG